MHGESISPFVLDLDWTLRDSFEKSLMAEDLDLQREKSVIYDFQSGFVA